MEYSSVWRNCSSIPFRKLNMSWSNWAKLVWSAINAIKSILSGRRWAFSTSKQDLVCSLGYKNGVGLRRKNDEDAFQSVCFEFKSRQVLVSRRTPKTISLKILYILSIRKALHREFSFIPLVFVHLFLWVERFNKMASAAECRVGSLSIQGRVG